MVDTRNTRRLSAILAADVAEYSKPTWQVTVHELMEFCREKKIWSTEISMAQIIAKK